MYTRATDNRIWSRPIILLPAAFLGDPSRYGMPAKGVQEKLPGLSENQSSPLSTGIDIENDAASSAFMTSLPYFAEPSDLQMGSLFTADNSNASTKPRLRKSRRNNTKSVIKAEDVPEYKGQMPVDDLVNFINSGTSKKSSTKKKMIKNTDTYKLLQHNDKTNRKESLEISKSLEPGKMENNANESSSKENSLHQYVALQSNGSTDDSGIEGNAFPADSSYWKDFTIVKRKKKEKLHRLAEDDNKANNSAMKMHFVDLETEISQVNKTVIPTRFNPTSHKVSSSSKENKSIIPKPEKVHSDPNTRNSSHTVAHPHLSNGCTKLEPQRKCLERSDVLKADDSSSKSTKADSLFSGTNAASNIRTDDHHSVAKLKSQRQPVVFVDGKETEFAEIGVSFGFNMQDLDSGFESPGDVDFLLLDSCCREAVQSETSTVGSLGERLSDAIPPKTRLNCADTDENNNMSEQAFFRFRDLRQTKSILVSSTTLDVSKLSKQGTSNDVLCKNSVNSDNEKNKKQNVYVNGTVSILGQIEKKTESAEALELNNLSLNCIALTKKSSISSDEGIASSLTNVKCCVHKPCAVKPISIVAPNQPVNSCSSGKLISIVSQRAESVQRSCRTSHQEQVHSSCTCTGSSPSHSLSQSLGCGDPCTPAPVLKVAPMLVEISGTGQVPGEPVNYLVKEIAAKQVIILDDKVVENEQKNASISLKFRTPKTDEEIIETTAVDKSNGRQPQHDQIGCTTTGEANSQDYFSVKEKLQLSRLEDNQLFNQDVLPDNTDNHCVHHEKASSPDDPIPLDPEFNVEIIDRLTEKDGFDLFSAQIFLYKSYEDCISTTHTVHTISHHV